MLYQEIKNLNNLIKEKCDSQLQVDMMMGKVNQYNIQDNKYSLSNLYYKEQTLILHYYKPIPGTYNGYLWFALFDGIIEEKRQYSNLLDKIKLEIKFNFGERNYPFCWQSNEDLFDVYSSETLLEYAFELMNEKKCSV